MSYSLEIVQQKMIKIHEWRKCKTSSTLLNANNILRLNILYAIYAMASSIKKSNISFLFMEMKMLSTDSISLVG